MTTNEFLPVVFNDGEPLDPTKLNQLVKNVNNIYQSASLANQTSSGTLAIPIIFTQFMQFEKVKPGQMASRAITFGEKFTSDEIQAGKVYAVAGCRSGLGDGDNITVSISGIKTNPTVFVVNNHPKDSKTISVDIIAMVMREVI